MCNKSYWVFKVYFRLIIRQTRPKKVSCKTFIIILINKNGFLENKMTGHDKHEKNKTIRNIKKIMFTYCAPVFPTFLYGLMTQRKFRKRRHYPYTGTNIHELSVTRNGTNRQGCLRIPKNTRSMSNSIGQKSTLSMPTSISISQKNTLGRVLVFQKYFWAFFRVFSK